MAPTFSVVVPTHNRRDFLPGAIASVLAQSFTGWELVVIDDGSQDDTASVMEPFLRDPRVRYEIQSQQGRSTARNHGIQMARGEWVAFLDSDDRYLPNCLEAHHNTLAKQPNLAMTIGGYEYIDEAGRRLGERRPWDESDLSLSAWLFNCLAMPGSTVIGRSWLAGLGGFDPGCEIAEDWDLFLRLAYAGGAMAWVKTSVCQYRQHAGQSVAALAQHHQGSLRALEKLFQQPNVPASAAAQAGRSIAWVHALFAHRAFLVRQPEMACGFLARAVARDPELGGTRKLELIEFLLSPVSGQTEPHTNLAADVLQHHPDSLAISARDIRRAQTQVAMASLIRWSGRLAQPGAWPAIRHAYWQGVRQDPRWLGNRGLWSILLRAWAARP